jgi:hypothetical protein
VSEIAGKVSHFESGTFMTHSQLLSLSVGVACHFLQIFVIISYSCPSMANTESLSLKSHHQIGRGSDMKCV